MAANAGVKCDIINEELKRREQSNQAVALSR
jgi:hypothetical protein